MTILVLDPGHGGTQRVEGSSPNNATSASGVLEKDICLDLARRIRFSLTDGTAARHAADKGVDIGVVMTRDSDTNLGLAARAAIAAEHNADFYLSIHCNGFDGSVRGTECWIDRKFMTPKQELMAGRRVTMPGPGVPSSGLRNLNVDSDAAFAKAVVDAVLGAFKHFDSAAKLRSDRYTRATHGEKYQPPEGVKMMGLGTLRDAKLGTSNNNCRSALLELEFIDHPSVDQLLNGAQSVDVRNRLAVDIAIAIIDSI